MFSNRVRTCLHALACGVLVLFLGARADAFERQWHAGVDLGLGVLSWDDEVSTGPGGGVHLAYGITDSYNLMVEAGLSSHAIHEGHSSLIATHGAVGMGYTLDVISWVPYLGILVGGYRFSGAELQKAEHRLGFQAALGLDYRPSRSWALGIQLRYHTFTSELFETHYMTSFGRFEWLWGW